MIPIERKPELLVPVQLMPGLCHLHLAVHPPALMLPDGVPDMGSNLCHPGSFDNICNIRQGKVLAAIPGKGRVLVEGINVVHKAMRKSQDNPKGGGVRILR